MTRTRGPCAALAAALQLACTTRAAVGVAPPPAVDPAIPTACERELVLASRLGVRLFQEFALTSWAIETVRKAGLATDEYLVGMVTTRDSRGAVVHFVRRYQGDLTEPFRVKFARPELAAASLERLDPPAALDAETAFLFQVRELGTDQSKRVVFVGVGLQGCGRNYAVIMLPPGEVPEEEEWLVYTAALPPRDGWLFGEQVRHVISADARDVLTTEPLTRGCQRLPETTPRPRKENGTRSCPGELDVWLSLLHRKPLEIQSDLGLWEVSGTSIRFLRPAPATKAPRPAR